MGHFFHIAQSQRQHGLGSLQCLDFGLLIYAEHHGVTRRSQVQTYNVMHLIHWNQRWTVDLEILVSSARVRTLQWLPLA